MAERKKCSKGVLIVPFADDGKSRSRIAAMVIARDANG
jgi:hypothetical protein